MQFLRVCNLWLKNVFVPLIIILTLEVLFFSSVIFQPDKLIGEPNDSRLNNLLVEHWYQSFLGNETLSEVNIFYPLQNTLAYTDMLFGFAIPYSLLRFCGLNMYLANKIVLIAIHAFGSFSLFYLLKKKFKLSHLLSLLGVIIFSYSSAYYIRSGHTQMFAISFVPLLLIFVYNFFTHLRQRQSTFWSGMLALGTFILLMYTGWYIAFFAALFTCCFIFFYLLLTFINSHQSFVHWCQPYLSYFRQHWRQLAIYLVTSAILLIPFVKMYSYVNKIYGARTYYEVTRMLPELVDFINVSPDNVLIGKLIDRLHLRQRHADSGMYTWELEVGFSFVVFGIFALLCFYWLELYFKNKYSQESLAKKDPLFYFKCVLTLTILFSLLLLVQSHKLSLWFLIYKFFPAGSSIRAAVRYNFFLTLPLAILLPLSLQDIFNHWHWRKNLAAVVSSVLCALVLFSNLRNIGLSSRWTITEEESLTASIAAPPRSCQVFYLVDKVKQSLKEPRYEVVEYQILAWEIANKYHLYTINGYSGQWPHNWNLWHPDQLDINRLAQEWIEENNIDEQICSYDLYQNQWDIL